MSSYGTVEEVGGRRTRADAKRKWMIGGEQKQIVKFAPAFVSLFLFFGIFVRFRELTSF